MMYVYKFTTNSVERSPYYIYASCKEVAIAKYLKHHKIEKLPKDITIERIVDNGKGE